MANDSLLKSVAPLAVLTFLAVYNFPMKSEEEKAQARVSERSVYYRYCSNVRAAGQAPLHAGEPGYAPHLDGDGVACEPYSG